MRLVLKRLAKMVVGYGAVQWAGPALSFIFTPIITRILSPSDYGISDYILTIASAVTTLALFALPQALNTHFNDHPEIANWKPRVTGTALLLVLLTGAPLSALLAGAAPLLAQSAFHNSQYDYLFVVIGVGLVFALAGSILVASAQAALRVRWGMVLSLVTILGTVLGNVVYIIILRWGVLGMLLTPVTTWLATFVAALVLARSLIGPPTRKIAALLARSGAVLMPAMIATWTIQVADRLFLIYYVPTESLGHYAIANRIAALIHVAMSPVYAAWLPLALAMKNEPDAPRRYADVARYLVTILLTLALGLGLFATEVLIVLTRTEYLPAAPYVGFLAYMHVFGGMTAILSTGALAGKQLGIYSWAAVSGAVVNILLNFVLIPQYGVWGATIATIIAFAIPLAVLYPILQKRYPIPYPTLRVLGALFVESALMSLAILIPPMAFPIRVALKSVILLFFLFTLISTGMVTRSELRHAWLFVRHQWQMRVRPV